MKVLLLSGLLVLAMVPARAATEVALAGHGVLANGSCLELAGAQSVTANRGRWLSAYWSDAGTPLPGGFCDEADDHIDPTIECALGEAVGDATIVSFRARGPRNVPWLFKVIDRSDGVDEFGALQAPPGEGTCGAAAVSTEPVVAGGFVTAIV